MFLLNNWSIIRKAIENTYEVAEVKSHCENLASSLQRIKRTKIRKRERDRMREKERKRERE